jgi:chromosome segregation ATPase
MTNTEAAEAAGWQCAGCGVASPDRYRSCDCPTNVVVRAKEQAWKIDRISKDADADEACQQLCRNHGFATGHGDTIADMISEIDGHIKDRLASLREQNNIWPHEVERYKAYAEKFEQENASLRERERESFQKYVDANEARIEAEARAETAERRVAELEDESAGFMMTSVIYKNATAKAERERDEARAALKPFAEAADDLADTHKDHMDIWEAPAAGSITAGNLRAARAIMED